MISIFSSIRLILTLRCDGASHLVSDSLDRGLTRTEGMAVRTHLMICGNCRRFRRQLQFLRQAVLRLISGAGPGMPYGAVSLSAQARQRIQQALSGEDDS